MEQTVVIEILGFVLSILSGKAQKLAIIAGT
jgi:hypothetical protein